jgi:fluoroquinolone transport system permease protein
VRRLLALAAGDARNVGRDPMLTYLPLVPFFMTLALRLLIPWVTELVARYVDLTLYYDFIAGFLLLMTPVMVGMVAGFVLLDERDENILAAVGVTPLSKTGFLFYKMASATVLSLLLSWTLVAALGLVPLRPLRLIVPAVVAAAEAPLLALFMGAFAANKVEGLVLAKASGLLFLAPLALLFVPPGWQWLAGVIPTYWVTRCFLTLYGDRGVPGFWISAAVGLVYHAVLIVALARRFARRAE